jgi:hypothetical protein
MGGMCILINEAGNGHGIAVFTKAKAAVVVVALVFVICAASPIPHFRRRLMQMNEKRILAAAKSVPCAMPH